MKIHEKSLLGKRCYGFNTYRGAEFIDTIKPVDREVLVEDTKSSIDALLDSIFSIDPITKLPTGDISVFLNSNTSDSVKKYIQDNLLVDNGGSADSSKYSDLPDSVIADYARSQNETIYQYRDRVIGLIRKNVEIAKKEKSDKS